MESSSPENDADEPFGPLNDSFPPTQWTQVRKAANSDEEGSLEALNKLCEKYWYPLYAYVRHQGASPHDAADEIQGFFENLLERDFLKSADQEKGKLRSFLISALKKFRSNEYRKQQAQKRGGGQIPLSIDKEWAEGRFEIEPANQITAEQLLDRAWAGVLLDTVMLKLKEIYIAKDKEKDFQVMSRFLAWKSDEDSYAEGAKKLGISEGNLRIKVHRMRSKYRELLENEVRLTLDKGDAESINEELRYLLDALGSKY